MQKLFSPGIEPGTFCVLDRCDNRYTTKTVSSEKQVRPMHQLASGVVLTFGLHMSCAGT